jgi:hypothetical protein
MDFQQYQKLSGLKKYDLGDHNVTNNQNKQPIFYNR